jgi:tetratricopeptide (TPR) repeat protein
MQTALFDHYLRFLTTMAKRSPLLLVLDDLQWADVGTVGLLFHISRNLAGQPLFVLGAFRPEEITVGQAGVRHPLQTIVHEGQKEFGEIILPLGQEADPSFVEAFVDIEPNNLDKTFRTRLFELTGGHPLYTAELMRGLQERGDLFKDSLGRWQAGNELDWDALPPRVEGVIAERIGRLPPDSRSLLQAAAVQGETFIAEVAAQALEANETRVASALGNELSRVHRLVRAQRLDHTGDGQDRLSTYQFHHFLFQKYLYDHLDPVEKARLHEVTGKALASRVGEDALETSVQLARHFEAAGMPDRAVDFLLQAGNHAIKLAANDEAGRHFAHGLALLVDIPATPERAQLELALQLGLGTAYQLNHGYGASVAERAYSRALDLCGQAGDSPQLVAALWPLATYATMVGDLPQGVALAEQALAIALRTEEPLIICVAHHHVGWILHHCGRLAESVAHQEETIALYDRQYHEPMVRMFGHDFGITSLGWSAWPLCCLGFPDKALQRCHEAIALAQSFDHPFSLMHAYGLTAQTHYLRGELVKAGEFAERTFALAEAYGFASYIAAAHFTLGAGQIGKGHFARGLAHWRTQLDLFEAGGVRLYHRGSLATLAGVLTQLGQLEEAQSALAQADAIGYHDYTDALIETFRGQLLAAQGHAPEEVEACFLRAIQIAQEMEAKLFELQATMSLSELWRAQGRQEEARQRLAAVYSWFKEGFDTPILQAAAAMLDELA